MLLISSEVNEWLLPKISTSINAERFKVRVFKSELIVNFICFVDLHVTINFRRFVLFLYLIPEYKPVSVFDMHVLGTYYDIYIYTSLECKCSGSLRFE
jgi:hypothetical protein